MKRVISKRELLVLFSYVIFIACTSAEPHEVLQSKFIAHRQSHQEARLSAKTGSDHPQFVTIVHAATSGDVTASTSMAYGWAHVDNHAGSASVTNFPGNFSVAPGDTIRVSVTASSNSSATLKENNLSNGESANATVNAPDTNSILRGLRADGMVNEFRDDGSSVAPGPFPIFSNLASDDCAATTTTRAKLDLTTAGLMSMVDAKGKTLLWAGANNNAELAFKFLSFV